MSERIIVVGGPWPQRIGLHGAIVDKPRHVYPWAGLGCNEVVILVDDDPLTCRCHRPPGDCWAHHLYGNGEDWSCVIDRGDIRRTTDDTTTTPRHATARADSRRHDDDRATIDDGRANVNQR